MSLRNRWLLGTCLPIVLALASIAALIHVVLGRVGEAEARGWFESVASRALPALDASTFAGLRRITQIVYDDAVSDSGVEVPNVVAVEELLANQPQMHVSIRDVTGALRGGADCPGVVLDEAEQAHGYVICMGAPALAASRRMGDDTVTVYRLIEANYLHDIARVVQADVMLLGADGVVQSTLRDTERTVYTPLITDLDGLVLRPESGTSFGVASLEGNAYGGYLDSELAAGSRQLPSYLLSSRVPGVDYWIVLAVPRLVMNQGRIYAFRLIAGAIAIVTIGLAAYVAGFVRRVTVPLARLSEAAGRVESGDLTVVVPVEGRDELAQLGHSFNHMVSSIRDGRRELAQLSRLGGMAEVATGVLHNVGNVLNSVNVSVGLLSERASRARVPRLLEACDLLALHQHDLADFVTTDPRGRLLPTYIARAARAIEDERSQLLTEVEELKRNVERINSVVAMQQSHARGSTALAVERLDAVLEDAIKVVHGAYLRHEVPLVRDYADLPPFPMDASRIVQILVNLLRNARDASTTGDGPPAPVVVRTRQTAEGVAIEVQDGGVGVAPEDLVRIFAFGHTTKIDGHGFGLHMSALAAQGMGGALGCRSEGVGRGATFTLLLPVPRGAALAS